MITDCLVAALIGIAVAVPLNVAFYWCQRQAER